MPLFQKSVVNKYLAEQDNALLEKKYSLFKLYFLNTERQKNIIASKEEEFQEGFLRELFVIVLGYTINPDPDYNLKTELKNIKDAKKADGAIIDRENVLAVIELKGTDTTNLNNIEVQAFSYKNNQVNCRYIITSNFQKLRFYIDNAIEYVEWDLFKLSYEQFKLLYLCLSKESILKNLPATIKQQSIIEEENVTKKLYKEYSSFRRTLFNSIVELNPSIDKLLLFKKTQKLLDRFLFLLFAEDRMLVPPNSVREILSKWIELKEKYDEYQPLYERFKKHFVYLNEGYIGKEYEIFAYNGGLFALDEILDSIKVEDDILYSATLNLSTYDYNSEVDVDILGHIFEHSLTEIEELEQEIISSKDEIVKTTKRKKDGVFYTPKYITKYIVENTLGQLCKLKKEELGIVDEEYVRGKRNIKTQKPLLQKLYTYRDWLLNVTIVDPACGSGAFLNQALEFLIYEHESIAYLESIVTKKTYADDSVKLLEFSVESHILENNLFGVDINEESVEIAKLSLWLRTARKGRKLNSLNHNIKCGNSLIEDEIVAGSKAFNWQNEFPKIFEKGGFDIVIGNPPYATGIFTDNEKVFFNANYSVAQYQIDLYVLFIQKGIVLLKDKGIISYITPNSWLKNLMMSDCRYLVINELQLLSIIPNLPNVFIDASVDSMIFNGIKRRPDKDVLILELKNSEFIVKHSINQLEFLKNNKYVFSVEVNSLISGIIMKMNNATEPLEKHFDIIRGINPYDSYTGQSQEIIKSKAYHSDHEKDSTFVPEIRGKHAKRYFHKWDGKHYISYGSWLAAPRDESCFKGERIVFREILGKNFECTIVKEEIKIDRSLYIAKPKSEELMSINYAQAILASTLLAFYFRYTSNEFDVLFPKIRLEEFKKLPIKIVDEFKQLPFNIKVDAMLSLFRSYDIILSKFINLLSSKFPSLNINGKLGKWDNLNFLEFNKELNKQKIKLALDEQSEWLSFFEQEKQKALLIKNEIDSTDKEIDALVYALYELTDEEIKIVEL